MCCRIVDENVDYHKKRQRGNNGYFAQNKRRGMENWFP